MTSVTQPFADAVLEAEKIITGASRLHTEQDLAEGYDYLAGNISSALQPVRRPGSSR